MDIKKISEQIQKTQKGQFKPDHLNGFWAYAVVHIIDLFVYNTSMNQNSMNLSYTLQFISRWSSRPARPLPTKFQETAGQRISGPHSIIHKSSHHNSMDDPVPKVSSTVHHVHQQTPVSGHLASSTIRHVTQPQLDLPLLSSKPRGHLFITCCTSIRTWNS